jgi:protein-disulfide isomerase
MDTSACRLLGLALCLIACSRAPAEPRPAASPVRPLEAGDAVAHVEGEPITRSEVDAKAATALSRVREEEYRARRAAIDELVIERLLDREAKARGISREALLQREVDRQVPVPSAQEIDAVYEQNKARFSGRSRQEMIPQIERAMRQQALEERRRLFTAELRGKSKVVVTLAQPRTDVPLPPGTQASGPANAPITMVEFSDYLCPYCQRAEGTVNSVLARNAGKVKFVHQDYLLGRPRSLEVARAAHCAGDQGKFWEYRKALLESSAGWDDAQLNAHAQRLGVDQAGFAKCLASDRHDEDINGATERGRQLGVDSTPTFFINGRRLTGAQPAEQFQQIIDDELSAAGR